MIKNHTSPKIGEHEQHFIWKFRDFLTTLLVQD